MATSSAEPGCLGGITHPQHREFDPVPPGVAITPLGQTTGNLVFPDVMRLANAAVCLSASGSPGWG